MAVFCSRPAEAQNTAFSNGLAVIEFDPGKSTAEFSLGALLHTVHGTFKVKNGVVRFDASSGHASGQIVVDVPSGESGDKARDRQMHENVLQSDRFPEAVFSPDHVEGQIASSGASRVQVHGSLRVHGGDHEVTIPVKVNVQNNSVTATGKFSMPYVAWGMKDPSNLILRVDKTVELEVTLQGTK
jgi:polyisoprenoid-binding protein YceI